MTPTLYGLAVLSAALAWLVARHRPEHRPIAGLLAYGLASDVVRRLVRLNVLQPARAELGGAPFTGWVRVAGHVESALFVGWMELRSSKTRPAAQPTNGGPEGSLR